MIGTLVCVIADIYPKALMEYALSTKKRVSTPMAPAEGLFLNECMFDKYNKKFAELHCEIARSVYGFCKMDICRCTHIYKL